MTIAVPKPGSIAFGLRKLIDAQMTALSSSGTLAARPAAVDYGVGYYAVTDDGGPYLSRSDGAAWTVIGGKADPPGTRVFNTTNTNLLNNALTILPWDSERFDSDAIHSTVTNTSRLTCKTPGVYAMVARPVFSSNGAGRRLALLKLNGATYIDSDERAPIGGGNDTPLMLATQWKLALNDYVEVEVFQSSGGTITTRSVGSSFCDFSMHYLGKG